MSRTIGSYEVVERRRGQGERYALRRGDRRFACRLLEMPADEDVVEQTEREIRIVGDIDHPAGWPVREIFPHQGKLAVVWDEPPEDSRTLGSLIAASALPPAAAWWVGHQLSGLLAQSHAASDGDDFLTICHGHLEPSLVAVLSDGTVRMLGLGLGPLVGNGLVAHETFAAPEQRGGGRVTPRGDLYTVAVLLWSMLTGTVPMDVPTIEDVEEHVPAGFREAFARALEQKVGKRKITSMEFEQWLGDLSGGGQAALQQAVQALQQEEEAAREEQAGVSVPRRQSSTQRGVGPAPTPRRQASTRRGLGQPAGAPKKSRQPTLLGQATPEEVESFRKKVESAGPAPVLTPPAQKQKQPSGIDWSAAAEAAQRPSAPPGLPLVDPEQAADDLDWGEDQPTQIATRPSAETIAEAQARLAAEGKLMPSPLGDEEETILQPSPLESGVPRHISPARPLAAAEVPRGPSPSQPDVTGQPIAPAPPVGREQHPSILDVDDDDEATMVARSPLEEAESGEGLSASEIDQAIAMADSAIDEMDGSMSDEPTAAPETSKKPTAKRPLSQRGGSLLGGLGAKKKTGTTPEPPSSRRGPPSARGSSPGVPPPRGSSPSRPDLPPPRGSSPSRPDVPPPRPSSPSRPGAPPARGTHTTKPDFPPSKDAPMPAAAGSEPELPPELEHAMVGGDEPQTQRVGPQSNEAVSVRAPVILDHEPADEPTNDDVDHLKATLPIDGDDDDLKATLALDTGIDPEVKAELERAEKKAEETKPAEKPAARAPAESEPVLDVSPPKLDAPRAAAPPSRSDGDAADSPWSKESKEKERPQPDDRVGEPISLVSSVLITLGTAAVVMGAGIWYVRQSASATPPTMPAATSAPTPQKPPRKSQLAATAKATAAPTATVAPSASASAAPPDKDPAKLPPTVGYLRVSWSGDADAQVFLFGKSIGKVGEPVEVPCSGMQNVLVGTADRRWLSDGRPVKVGCRKLTELTIEPKKQAD